MKKSLIALALTLSLLVTSQLQTAQAQTCYDDCIAGGNTPLECNAACGNAIPGFDDPNDAINPVQAPTQETFDSFNPLQIAGGETIDDETASEFAEDLSTPGGIISRLLSFIFPLAGLILFLMISWGGFEMLVGSGDSSKVQAGRQRVTAAIVGFLVLFASYWMVQIVEAVFGIVIF